MSWSPYQNELLRALGGVSDGRLLHPMHERRFAEAAVARAPWWLRSVARRALDGGLRRPPDFLIGPEDDPYLVRWHILPRNRFCGCYLHLMRRSDPDLALHDHPWPSASLILAGGYREVLPESVAGATREVLRQPGDLTFRRATAPHRLAVVTPGLRAVSLFFMGPVLRGWGYHCPSGWIPWEPFVDARDAGSVGGGCGEAVQPGGWFNRTPTYRKR